jgi:hypothetical protein
MLEGLLLFCFGCWVIKRVLAPANTSAYVPDKQQASYSGIEEFKCKLAYENDKLREMLAKVSAVERSQSTSSNSELDALVLQDSLAREARYKAVLSVLMDRINIPAEQQADLLEAVESPEYLDKLDKLDKS